MPASLFNGDHSDSDVELKINADYAKNYNNWRQKEELNKLKTKYGSLNENETSGDSSDSDTSTEEEEEVENELKKQFDKDFYRTLALLKNKDPKIYKEDVTFFADTNKAQESQVERKKEKGKKEKPVFLRDFERKIIVERDGKFSDSEDETQLRKSKQEAEKLTYTQEQQQLKESFKHALRDEEDEGSALLLKPKIKSEKEKQQEEADYREWLKGQEASINGEEQEVLKPLRDFWTNPNLDANEKFLRDYVLENKHLNKNYAGFDEDENEDETRLVNDNDDDLSEDEELIEKQEEFEHKYNFRFEEPDQEFIKRYPRTMENSLRRKDTRRAQKRAEVKKRKEEEKLRKKEELKQLKALKRKEIEQKIEKLKEITGNDDIKFNDIDLDADFDPSEHDKKMTEIFNDDYYAAPEGDTKPEFPDIDQELDIEDTWDNYDPAEEHCAIEKDPADVPHCEDPDFNMDADYDPSKKLQEEVEGPKRRKRRRKSKFAELIAKEKPKFDPEQYKCYEEYFDKYYSLDYEDMIGDIPCRFKYRKVVPNDYGLSVEEIIMADDKELNKWCSLKKALQYKPEHAEINDVRMYKQKARNEALKRKILRSLYTDPEEEEKEEKKNEDNTIINGDGQAKKRRRKKKKKEDEGSSKNEDIADNVDTVQQKIEESPKAEKRKASMEQSEQLRKKKSKVSVENSSSNDTEAGKKWTKNQTHAQTRKKVKKKDRLQGKKLDSEKKGINSDIVSMDPERLRTYGINPKKLKNKLKYGNRQR